MRAVEVVALSVRMIKILRTLHCSDNLSQKRLCLTAEMFMKPIGVHINLVLSDMSALSFVIVLDEVDLARLNVENKRGVMLNCKRTLDAILLQNGPDGGSKFLLHFLRHVSHDVNPFVSVLMNLI